MNWNQLRATQFPVCESWVFLNHAGVAPLSVRARDAMARLLDDHDLRARFGAYSRLKAERDFDQRRVVVHALTELGLLPRSG